MLCVCLQSTSCLRPSQQVQLSQEIDIPRCTTEDQFSLDV